MSPFNAILPTLMLLAGHALAQECPANVKRTAPDSRYETLNGGAEVWDKQTNLVWQRCSLGQSWNGSTCAGVATAHTWRQALEAANASGGGWLLPNHRELLSLVEWGCQNPVINTMTFPNTVGDGYWSSSSIAGAGENAYFVGFNGGLYSWALKTGGNYVRLVRSR